MAVDGKLKNYDRLLLEMWSNKMGQKKKPRLCF